MSKAKTFEDGVTALADEDPVDFHALPLPRGKINRCNMMLPTSRSKEHVPGRTAFQIKASGYFARSRQYVTTHRI